MVEPEADEQRAEYLVDERTRAPVDQTQRPCRQQRRRKHVPRQFDGKPSCQDDQLGCDTGIRRHSHCKHADKESNALGMPISIRRPCTNAPSGALPLSLPAAGSHGLERRSAAVPAEPLPAAPAELVDIKAQAQALLATWPLAVIEDKGLALALHWRAMPEAAVDLQAFALQAQARMPGYQLQHGDCVVELRPRRADKGEAIAAFLGEPPFRGRLPVFVGDDLTDEHGFEVVNARGGLSVLVGERAGSLARHRLPGVDAVHAWLGVAA